MNNENDINKEIYNYNILYYYFLYLSIFFVLFLILGIFLIYKTKNISYLTWIVLLFLFTLFLENIGLFLCFNKNNNTIEGWNDYQCYRIYSQYATVQSQIDQFDVSYVCLKNAVNNLITNLQSSVTQLGASINENGEIIKKNGETISKYQSLQNIVNSKIDTINTNLNPNHYSNIKMKINS